MVSNELTHWGIKGMKWGIRRFQNKDGSLTAKGKKRYSEKGDDSLDETVETKRAKLLKSTDAKELYKNRDLLTTQELNDRLNRINTEQRLSEIAAKQKKSGYDRIDKALKFGRKVNEVYEFTNTPVMKQIKKALFGDKTTKNYTPNLKEALSKVSSLSDDELKKILARAGSEKALRKMVEDLDSK